jgi:short-subunit dehydrogenase
MAKGDFTMGNQLAVVTGASSGIGYNLAKVFAENGFDLMIASNGERLEKAEEDFKALGVRVTAIQADLATFEGVDEFWETVENAGRPVDAIAINAGFGVGGKFAETNLDEEVKMIRLNVEGTTHIAKHAVKHMLSKGGGKILITSSIAGEMVAPREAVYAASKAYDLSFAKSLRAELEDTGITVTALQPGPTDTDFFHRAHMDDTKVGSEGKKDSEPYQVAKQGFEALMNGEKHVYAASFQTRFQGAVANLVPDAVKAAMHEKMAKPVEQ